MELPSSKKRRPHHQPATPDGSTELELLITQIKDEFRETAHRTGCTALSPKVEQALRKVPRHSFVPPEERHYAYGNHPLPIGFSQTISQPYIVALMTDILELDASSRVLEIGTGCGYQTAVLAELVNQVFSVEIIAELGDAAAGRITQLGYANAHIRIGDGHCGWPEAAPFDAIIVTACAEEIPELLMAQLASAGHMIIPLQVSRLHQELVLVTKTACGEVQQRSVLPVRFVPFTSH